MDGKKRSSNILIMLEALGLALVLVLSILTSVFAGVKKASGKENTKQEQPTENAVTEDVSYDIFTEGAVVFDDEIEEKIASMTTEEKVAQMFLVSPEDFTGNDEVTVAGEGCKGAIETYPVGGMVVSRANFLDKDVTADNLSNLQTYSSDRIGCELLLVVEQGAEGNEAVSAVDYMKQTGVNAIRLQAYVPAGDADPSVIEEEIRNRYYDYQDQGMLGIVPFAADSVMTAEGASEDTLTNYRNGFAKSIKDAWGIQMGSGTCKLITGKEATSLSLSTDAVKVIRNEMNYGGLLISAPLTDEPISGSMSVAEAAVQAVCCGMSMLYVPRGFAEGYQAVMSAVNDGTITDTMLHNAVGRILTAKKNMSSEKAADAAAAQAEAQAAAEQAAQQNSSRSNRNNNHTQEPQQAANPQADDAAAAQQAAAEAAAAQQAAAEAAAQQAAAEQAAQQPVEQIPQEGQ